MEELNRKLENNMFTIYFLLAIAISVLVAYLIVTMFSYRHTVIDGWADSTYVLEKKGEHYVLVSPEKSWDVWDWGAYHRIGKWIFDEENNIK